MVSARPLPRSQTYHRSALWQQFTRVRSQSALTAEVMEALPFPDESQFKAGGLKGALPFWSEQLLPGHPARQEITGWLKDGVSLMPYLQPPVSSPGPTGSSEGGRQVILPSRWEPNRVPHRFQDWVSSQIQEYVVSGAVAPWIPRDRGSARPTLIHALSVEPSKPRLIYDCRFLNSFIVDRPFVMEGLGAIPSLCPIGAYQATLDHKSGFHHVRLESGSQHLFGFEWDGQLYTWTALPFGFKLSPWIYQTLSDCVSAFVRSCQVPCTAWLDDFWVCGGPLSTVPVADAMWRELGNRAVYLLCAVTLLAGYYISRKKSALTPTRECRFLGLLLDSATGRFVVPSDKKASFLRLVREALCAKGLHLATLEKLAGKAVALTKAVPAAILFCRSFHRAIARANAEECARRTRKHDWVPLTLDMRSDLHEWLQLHMFLNGGAWLLPRHLPLRIETDASSRAWGGVLRLPDQPAFECASIFEAAELELPINVKEMLAVLRTITAFLHRHGSAALRNRRLDFYVDNAAAIANFAHLGGRSPRLTHCAKQLFYLQRDYHFLATFQWWSTTDNVTADRLSRPAADSDWVLHHLAVREVFRRFPAVGVDWMASPPSAIRTREGGRIPFVSRFHTGAEYAVNVFAQDMGPAHCLLGPQRWGYCFPPAALRLAVIHHAQACGARVIFILPDLRAVWWPMLSRAVIDSWPLTQGLPPTLAPISHLSPAGVVTPLSTKAPWRAFACIFTTL